MLPWLEEYSLTLSKINIVQSILYIIQHKLDKGEY